MNQSTKEIGQPEQEPNNEQTADSQQVSPSIANANVSSSVFTAIELEYLADLSLDDYFKNKSQFSTYKLNAVEQLIKKIEKMRV
jgi:hypothetical protein